MGESKKMSIKRIIKFLVILFIFSLLLSNFSFADENYDGEELRGKAQMEKLIEVKRKIGSLHIPIYITQPMDGEDPTEDEVQSKEYQEWLKKVKKDNERYQTVNDFISAQEEAYYVEEIVNNENINIQQYNDKEVANADETSIKAEYIIILVIIMVFILILYIIKRKKFLLIIDFIILLFILVLLISNHLKKGNEVLEDVEETTSTTRIEKVKKWRVKAIDNYDKETKELLDLLNGLNQDKKLEKVANDYQKNYIDKFNDKEVDLSKVINDYIIKCYYCVKRKANGKELYSDDLNVLCIFDDEDFNYDDTNKIRYSEIIEPKYTNIDDWKIINDLLSKNSMQGIYDNITDEDIQDYYDGVYLDKLVEKLDLIVKSKEDFDSYSIIPYKYFNIVRLDVEPLYKCKYWYLEKGDDIELKLPYQTTLKYEIAKYEKRDIKGWYYAEIKKLIYDYDDEKTIFAYYLDNKDNLNGLYTTVYSNGTYNIKDLTDEIKYSNVDVFTNTKNYDIDIKKIDNRLLVGSVLYSIDKTAIDYRTEEIFTKNFLNKYYELGIFPEYNFSTLNDITSDYINDEKRNLNKIICEVRDRKTRKVYNILFNVKWIDDKVDDIEYYIIPEDKMNLSYEEMYQLAFND